MYVSSFLWLCFPFTSHSRVLIQNIIPLNKRLQLSALTGETLSLTIDGDTLFVLCCVLPLSNSPTQRKEKRREIFYFESFFIITKLLLLLILYTLKQFLNSNIVYSRLISKAQIAYCLHIYG